MILDQQNGVTYFRRARSFGIACKGGNIFVVQQIKPSEMLKLVLIGMEGNAVTGSNIGAGRPDPLERVFSSLEEI